MRRDVKLGLAFSILVIGIAAAFCFPRKPSEPVAPQQDLESIQTLADAQLDYIPIRAYQTSALSTPIVLNTPEPAPVAIRQSLPVVMEIPAVPPPAPLRPLSTAIQPIDVIASQETVSTPVGATPRAELSEVTPPAAASVVENPISTPQAAPQFYVVEPGDTLSGISLKLFGTVNGYQQIYELNRHQLNSPHDLRAGMQLRLPASTSRETGELQLRSQSEIQRTSSGSASDAPPRQFLDDIIQYR